MPPPRITLAIGAALLGIAATLALGIWQLRRAAEKTALEQSLEAARARAPYVVRAVADLAAVAASVPRRVRIRGEFDNTHTWWLDNRPLAGRAGFVVVAPLRIEGTRETVLVSRGWAPRDAADRMRLPPIGRPAGVLEIEGIAVAELPRVYDLGDHGKGAIRQNLDFKDAAAETGSPVAHFVIQQTSPLDDALDRRWTSPASGAERNRGYAFQWFSLAALITVLLVLFGVRSLRSRPRMGRVA